MYQWIVGLLASYSALTLQMRIETRELAMTTVCIERHIEQVADGTAYKGHITIGEAKLEYELKFTVSIPELDAMPTPKDKTEARNIFLITVRKDDTFISLTDDEWSFFFSMLVEFAAEFYYNPQTRSSNESPIMGRSLRGESHMFSGLAEYGIGMSSKAAFDFGAELCALLNDSKFDCKIAV